MNVITLSNKDFSKFLNTRMTYIYLKLLLGMGRKSTSVGHHAYISQTFTELLRSDATHFPVLTPWKEKKRKLKENIIHDFI